MLVAVYGSLKKGFYNHPALGADAEFLGNSSVIGVMYCNGSYPKLYHPDGYGSPFNEDLQRKHELEVYRIGDKAYQGIAMMEKGAGYTSERIDTPYGEATIYYMPHNRFSEHDYWIEAYVQETPLSRLN